jgi:FkbM family methyltransferase
MNKEKYPGETINDLVNFFKVPIKGILHVGAHKCEELNAYLKYVSIDKILWVEAFPDLVKENLQKNPDLQILNEVVGDEDGKDIEFKITNNTLSSSMLDLAYHKEIHPHVVVTDILKLKTKKLKTILSEQNLEEQYNLLILDIQGAELLALHGLGSLLENFNVIYTEVNEKELYKDCCKLEDLDSYLGKFNFERKYINTLNGYGNALYLKK